MGCKVVKYVHLENCSTNAFKVKIRQTDLKRALVSGHPQGCMVHVWKNSVGGALWNLVIMEEQGLTWERVCDVGGHNSDLCICCWNCSYDFGVVYHTLSPSYKCVSSG